MSERDYYCSMKFRMMKIDTERKLTYNCDPATPQNINFEWLEKNPGQLFNTPLVVQERQLMLDNKRNTSCENCCFQAEDSGAVSPRILRRGYNKTHDEIYTQPEVIDLTIGSDCNLTCSYCVKEYSSAWRRDLLTNGNYDLNTADDRYTINIKDQIVDKSSQSDRLTTQHFQTLLKEIKLMAGSLKTVIITGGEPLLNNSLLDILDNLANVPDVEIFTGLGVDNKRFTRLIEQLPQRPNVRITISAEATEKIYEFNRYGAQWTDALTKIQILEKNNIKYRFRSTLSNLTVVDYGKFKKMIGKHEDEFDLVYQPNFMAVYVLDDHTKQRVIDDLNAYDTPGKDQIIKSILVEPTEQQRINIRDFLKEFTRRRPTLDITIYPKEFLNWIEYVV